MRAETADGRTGETPVLRLRYRRVLVRNLAPMFLCEKRKCRRRVKHLQSSSSVTGVIARSRRYHSIVWTGSEMIVWGGETKTNTTVSARLIRLAFVDGN
jgi:hypothetical protein